MVVSYLLKCLSQSGGRPFLVEYREKHLESSGLTVNTTTIVWYSLVKSSCCLRGRWSCWKRITALTLGWDAPPRSFSCSGRPAAWWLSTDSTSAGTRLHRPTGTYLRPDPERKHTLRIYWLLRDTSMSIMTQRNKISEIMDEYVAKSHMLPLWMGMPPFPVNCLEKVKL